MQMITELNKEFNLRIHIVKGELNKNLLIEKLKDIYENPDYKPDMNVLWDIREAIISSFFSADVQAVRDFVSKHWGTGGKSRAALVVSKDVDFGLARMYQILSESKTLSPVQVFRDFDEALNWAKYGK